TAILEKMRDQIHASIPAAADFRLGPGGSRTVFPLAGVTSITWNAQTGAAPATFASAPLNVAALRIIPDAVGQIAFGKYLAPDYELHPGEFIPAVGTRTGTPAVQGVNELYFNLFLPSGVTPPNGWPVAIYGHGGGGSKDAAPLLVAATMAKQGIATI